MTDQLYNELRKRIGDRVATSELDLLLVIAGSAHAAMLSGNVFSPQWAAHMAHASRALHQLAKLWGVAPPVIGDLR